MNHIRVGVACIVQRSGKILLGKRKGSHGAASWGPPGGHLELGESVEMCVKRELLEETGLVPLSWQLGSWVENIIGDKHYITLFVIIDKFHGEPGLLEPHKCEGWQWFAEEALPSPLFPTLPTYITKKGSLLSP